MKKNVKPFLLIIMIIMVCLNSTGCKKDDKEILNKKIITELEYLDTEITSILNSLNNLSIDKYTLISEELDTKKQDEKDQNNSMNSSSNNTTNESQEKNSKEENSVLTTQMSSDPIIGRNKNNINWEKIKNEIETINESWPIIALDLYSVNVSSTKILDFSSKLNISLIAIKNENKIESLSTLASLYTCIPAILQEINCKPEYRKAILTKSYVINAYSIADDINNSEIISNIKKAVELYGEIISDINFTEDKTYKTNKIFVQLNELENAVYSYDLDLFYLKYVDFIREFKNGDY